MIATAATSLAGCASTVAVDTSCRVFEPIAWSQKDTPQTKRAIVRHNSKFDAVCPAGSGAHG